MEIVKVENLMFTYPERTQNALCDITLTINKGEFVTLCGKSGCGKTTLLRLLKPTLSPHGNLSGNILFDGTSLNDIDTKDEVSKIGFVMQNPENSIVTDKVWHELAFGLENLGIKTAEIRARVSEMASFFGIEDWFYKNVTELSGGQKQMLTLASVMVMNPQLLILDEPTSQLDPIAAGEFLQTLKKINRELGTTIILSEHRLEEAFPISDRVVVMDEGKIIADDEPQKVGAILKSLGHDMYKALPTPMRVHGKITDSAISPVTIKDGRIWLEEYTKTHIPNISLIPKDKEIEGQVAVEIRNVYFRYEKNTPDVIKGLSAKIYKGELFTILGGNGSGKTTTLGIISGLNKPYLGEVLIDGKSLSNVENLYNGVLAVLPQTPHSVFVKKTVFLDFMDMMSSSEMTNSEKEDYIKQMAHLCKIDNLLNFHPYDLSGGEVQRAALCKVLLKSPKILLLDEPTKGLDAHFKSELSNILENLKANGVTIIMVSHDIEFCAENADRAALFFDGNITSLGTPRAFFGSNVFYTTSAVRLARTTIPEAVVAQDIIDALGGESDKIEPCFAPVPKPKVQNIQENTKQNQVKKHTVKPSLISLVFFLAVIPLTILFGIYFLEDRKYFFMSLLMIVETIIPFVVSFEKRKPTSRFLVLVSVLCAIAVAGRGAFFMVPQFKPVAALVIISGVCFGGETGFVVGAMSAFVSNFFFGQGPWTPWQMFGFGIIGFIAGIIFEKGVLKKTRLNLSTFGFLATLIIYGGIMNPASLIMWQNKISFQMIVSSYVVGLPFDLIHALSSFVFLFVLSKTMIDKIERIKIKYGV